MSALLWIVQAVLALLSLAGGAYKVTSYHQLAKLPATAALPPGAWRALGVFEMICGVMLIVPALARRTRHWTRYAAVAVAVESVALAAIYARYSLALEAANPLVWVVAMAVMAGFVTYGRAPQKS